MPLNRSQKLIITKESRVLRELRLERGLSLRQVGAMVGMSHSYVAHIEAGRMAVPPKPVLLKMLAGFGIEYRQFYERARIFQERMTPRQQLEELVVRMNDERVAFILKIAKGLAEGKAIVLV